jgi:hypothetical protein
MEVPMANVSPDNLVLRCYGYRLGKRPYVGICLDLNLAVEAESPEMLRKKMSEVIESYMETILDTEDKASISYLVSRKAPARDWVVYYIIKLLLLIRQFPNNFVFQEHLPFQLSHGC